MYLRGDSTGFPASSVSFGSSRLIFRGDSGLYLQDGNSRVRLDSNFGAIFALKTTTITAGDGLSGGGDLSANRTITANTKTGGGLTIITDSLAVDTLWNAKFASVTSNLGRFDTIGSKTKTVIVDTSAFQARDTITVHQSASGFATGLVLRPDVDNSIWAIMAGGTTRNAGGFLNLAGNMYTGGASVGAGGVGMFATLNGRNNPNIILSGIDSVTDVHATGMLFLPKTMQMGLLGSPTSSSQELTLFENTDDSVRRFSFEDQFDNTQVGMVYSRTGAFGPSLSFWEDLNADGVLNEIGAFNDTGWAFNAVGGNKITTTTSRGYFGPGISHVAKGNLLYSQGSTTAPAWSSYPFLYSSGANLGFGLTDTSINKNISSVAQSADTSAINFSFTNTGKPQMFMRGITGNTILAVDSQFVGIGKLPTTPLDVLYTANADGVTLTNTTNSAKAIFASYNDLSKTGAFGVFGSTFTLGLANAATLAATDSIILLSNGATASGATGHIQFRVGGYNATNERMRINSDGTIKLTSAVRGSDAFTTTATTDTVTVSGGATTDYYFITLTGTAAPAAADAVTVEALTGKFVLHRSASGTSGLTYNWFRIK